MGRIELGKADDGRVVGAHVGDEIVVVLDENPSTGYRWTARGTGAVLTVASAGYVRSPNDEVSPPGHAPDQAVLGRGGKREFRFRASSPGAAELVLRLKHEWEDDASSIASWAASVEVAEYGQHDVP